MNATDQSNLIELGLDLGNGVDFLGWSGIAFLCSAPQVRCDLDGRVISLYEGPPHFSQ